MPSIEWNRSVWDKTYTWEKDGDEWSQAAEFCGVDYAKWKDQLIRAFIVPYLRPESTALEIGPGHGRWSMAFPKRLSKGILHLVDLSPNCLGYCKMRLAEYPNVRYHANDGKSLKMIEDASIEFVWSFDTFVHVEAPEVKAYAAELRRVMKPQAIGVIHHPGNPTPAQRAGGARSQVDAKSFASILAENALHVIRQVDTWGDGCNLKMAGDTLSVFARP